MLGRAERFTGSSGVEEIEDQEGAQGHKSSVGSKINYRVAAPRTMETYLVVMVDGVVNDW